MRLDCHGNELCLQENQPISLEDAKGVTLQCTEGLLWLTLPGVADDIFLRAGQRYRLPTPEKVLLEAIGRGKVKFSNTV